MRTDKLAEEIGKTVQSELDWATKRGKKNVVTVFNLEEANLIIEVMGKMKKENTEMRVHDQTEYAFRNGYDKAIEDFLEGTVELRKKYIPTSSNDFIFGIRGGITECRTLALRLKAKNNGEDYTEDKDDSDDLQTHLCTDEA